MNKLLQLMANHLRYACGDRDYDSKKHYVFGLKTTLLTQKCTFYLTDGFEWVLGSWVHEQFILAPFVIAIGHGLDGGYWFLDGGWRVGMKSQGCPHFVNSLILDQHLTDAPAYLTPTPEAIRLMQQPQDS